MIFVKARAGCGYSSGEDDRATGCESYQLISLPGWEKDHVARIAPTPPHPYRERTLDFEAMRAKVELIKKILRVKYELGEWGELGLDLDVAFQ